MVDLEALIVIAASEGKNVTFGPSPTGRLVVRVWDACAPEGQGFRSVVAMTDFRDADLMRLLNEALEKLQNEALEKFRNGVA